MKRPTWREGTCLSLSDYNTRTSKLECLSSNNLCIQANTMTPARDPKQVFSEIYMWRLLRVIWKHLKASGSIWEASKRHLVASESIWKHLGGIWKHMEGIWRYLEASQSIWRRLGGIWRGIWGGIWEAGLPGGHLGSIWRSDLKNCNTSQLKCKSSFKFSISRGVLRVGVTKYCKLQCLSSAAGTTVSTKESKPQL